VDFSFRNVAVTLGLVGSLGGLLNFVYAAIAFLPNFDLGGALPTFQDLMILIASKAVFLVVPVLGFSGAAISYFMPRAGGPVLLAAVMASIAFLPDLPEPTIRSVAYFSGTALFFSAMLLVAVKADTWVKTDETENLEVPESAR